MEKLILDLWHIFQITCVREQSQKLFLRKVVLEIRCKLTEYQCGSVVPTVEITLRYECFPLNFLDIFRIPFHKNNSGVLLLSIY